MADYISVFSLPNCCDKITVFLSNLKCLKTQRSTRFMSETEQLASVSCAGNCKTCDTIVTARDNVFRCNCRWDQINFIIQCYGMSKKRWMAFCKWLSSCNFYETPLSKRIDMTRSSQTVLKKRRRCLFFLLN